MALPYGDIAPVFKAALSDMPALLDALQEAQVETERLRGTLARLRDYFVQGYGTEHWFCDYCNHGAGFGDTGHRDDCPFRVLEK